MNDARNPDQDPISSTSGPNPNRDRRRTAPLIEGKAREIAPEASTSEASTPEARTPEASPPENVIARPGQEPAASEGLQENPQERVQESVQETAPDMPATGPAAAPNRLVLAGGAAAAALLAAGLALWTFLPGDAQTGVDDKAALASLGARVEAVEARGDAALAALGRRVETLEKALASASVPKTQARVDQTLINSEPPAQKIDLAPFEGRLSELETNLARIGQRLKPLEDKIEPLPGAMNDLRAAMTNDGAQSRTGADRAQAAALVVVAQSIVSAIEAGRAYGQEIEALGTLKAPAALVDALRPSANGAPALPVLLAGFARLEPALNAPPTQADGVSLLDRLTSSASALVRVRPVSEPVGDSAPDWAARIERALARGDSAAALAQWERLPESAKAATADWAKAVRARTTAEQAARALLSDAMMRLARS